MKFSIEKHLCYTLSVDNLSLLPWKSLLYFAIVLSCTVHRQKSHIWSSVKRGFAKSAALKMGTYWRWTGWTQRKSVQDLTGRQCASSAWLCSLDHFSHILLHQDIREWMVVQRSRMLCFTRISKSQTRCPTINSLLQKPFQIMEGIRRQTLRIRIGGSCQVRTDLARSRSMVLNKRTVMMTILLVLQIQ